MRSGRTRLWSSNGATARSATSCSSTTCSSWQAKNSSKRNSSIPSTNCSGKEADRHHFGQTAEADATLEDRLRSRFASGLTTDVQPPELETRLAILLKRVEDESLFVGHDVLELIATHVKDNIRELDGALTRVAAYGALYGQKVTREMAESVLSDIIGSSKPRTITVKEIMDVTAETFGITVEELIGPSRRRPLVAARRSACTWCERCSRTRLFPRSPASFGDRDHTTVMHAVKKIKGLMDKRLPVYEQTTELMRRIRAGE